MAYRVKSISSRKTGPKFKVKKGDRVQVLTGRDKGKSGEILKMFPKEGRCIVSGINIMKRHQRSTPTSTGGIQEKEARIHISNVAYLDPSDDKPVRIGYKKVDGERKLRYAKRSGELIDS